MCRRSPVHPRIYYQRIGGLQKNVHCRTHDKPGIKKSSMKKFFNLNLLLSGLLMAACAFTFTACSDDDDDNNGGGPLDNPTYADDAVKLEITYASSLYSSIELTASGDYIVEKNQAGSYSAVKGLKSKERATTTPQSNSNVICGKYTKNADGSYNLANFGTIVIAEQSITITTSDGTTTTHTVSKSQKVVDMSSALFRTWKAAKFRVIAKGEGYNQDKTFNSFDAVEAWMEGEEGPDENPDEFWYQPTFEEVIISQYSTFAISAREYFGNTIVTNLFIPMPFVKTGTNSGKLSIDDSDTGMTFELNNNQLVVTYDESDEEDTFKMIITYNGKTN